MGRDDCRELAGVSLSSGSAAPSFCGRLSKQLGAFTQGWRELPRFYLPIKPLHCVHWHNDETPLISRADEGVERNDPSVITHTHTHTHRQILQYLAAQGKKESAKGKCVCGLAAIHQTNFSDSSRRYLNLQRREKNAAACSRTQKTQQANPFSSLN